MIDRTGQIQRVLALLHKHSDLVVEAMDSVVHLGAKARDQAIDAIASVHGLIPDGDGGYRLNPRLRDYLNDHLLSYSAFQSLTRLDEPIISMLAIWEGLKAIRSSGEIKDTDRLERAFDDKVTEITYEIERNMTLLNFMISTEYGNVSSLLASVQQIRFYRGEVRAASAEMHKLDVTIGKILGEAGQIEVFAVVRFLVLTRLRGRMSSWLTRLNDIQAVISARLGRLAKLENRLANLGKATLWLSQNSTSPGFQVDDDRVLPAALYRAERIRLKWHIDVRDHDPVVSEGLVSILNRLPAPAAVEGAEKAQPRALRVPPALVEDPVDPVELAILALNDHIEALAGESVSLLAWKQANRAAFALDTVTEEEWLFYASAQLVYFGLKPQFQFAPRTPDMLNDLFTDVVVVADVESSAVTAQLQLTGSAAVPASV